MVMEFPHTVLHFDSHQTNSSQIKLFIEVRLLCKNVAKPGSDSESVIVVTQRVTLSRWCLIPLPNCRNWIDFSSVSS